MQTNLMVIDNFYPDPDIIRDYVLAQKFIKYPKLNSQKNAGYNGLYYKPGPQMRKATMDQISKVIGVPIAYDLEGQGHFRLLTEQQERKKTTSVHVDHVRWSGVLSLIPGSLPQGETMFWRHKKSQLLGIHDLELLEKVKQGNPDFNIDKKDSNNTRAWENVMKIGYNYNRLILFNGNLFHSSAPGFGSNKFNAKLTQVFFFFEKGQQPKNLGIKWTYSTP
jgi:hypothetical protein